MLDKHYGTAGSGSSSDAASALLAQGQGSAAKAPPPRPSSFSATTGRRAAAALPGGSWAFYLSCCNPAYTCHEGDGVSHVFCAGHHCESGLCCTCVAINCCGPCTACLWAHRVRAWFGVDFEDFWGGY